MSSGCFTVLNVDMGSKEDQNLVNVNVEFKDIQKEPLKLCPRCAGSVLGSLGITLVEESESMEGQKDKDITKH